jgi:hypothetical protein
MKRVNLEEIKWVRRMRALGYEENVQRYLLKGRLPKS